MNTLRLLPAYLLFLLFAAGCANGSKAPELPPAEQYQADRSCSYFYFLWGTHAEYDQRFDEALEAFEKALICDPAASHIEKKVPVLLFRLGKIEEATKLLRVAVQKDPDDIAQYLLLAHLLIQQNEREEAITLYREVLKREPANEGVLLRLGILTVQQGHLKDAEKIFSQLLKQNPELYYARIYLARLNSLQGDVKKAAKNYESALKLNWSADLAIEMIEFYAKSNRQKDVLRLYDTIIANDPGNERALIGKVQTLLALGKDEEALTNLQNLRKVKTNTARVDMAIAKILLRMGKVSEARTHLDSLLKGDAANEANYLLALIAFQKKEADTALTHLGLVKPGSKEYSDAVYLQIRILRALGKNNQAITLLQNATGNPANENPLFYALLASIYQEQERIAEAMASITAGTLAFPKSDDLHFEHALLLDRSGMSDKALEAMQRVLEISPDHPEALNYIGYTWADRNMNLDQAYRYISRAVELKPENGFIRDSLGWVYYRLGNFQSALKELLKALELEPGDPHIYIHLGDVYRALNQPEDAIEAYQRGLEMLENENDRDSVLEKIDELAQT